MCFTLVLESSSIAKKINLEFLGETHQSEAFLKEKDNKISMLENELKSMERELAKTQKENDELKKLKKRNNDDTSWIQMPQGNWWKIERSAVRHMAKKRLGIGAWGEVWSGTFQGEPVAIKYVHQELVDSPNIIQMVQKEISILAHIHHPNLVRFIGAVFDHDVETRRDIPIIVLERLDTDLRTAYKHEHFSEFKMASIFCDVAYALHYLHEQTTPIIHRDISAPNILLKKLSNQFYRAKVSDFGSANLAKLSITAGAGAIIYTAPEMFPQEDLMADPPEQTVKVDVFSFGIVMLEVVCREMPVPEKRRAFLQTCETQWRFIYDLIQQCTKPDPDDRPTMRKILQYICLV